jgi:hypothetical protein
VDQVGITALNEPYALYWGNLNGMQDIGDWNGAEFNLFVTGLNNHVTKYVVEYGNSVAIVGADNKPGTILRALALGDAVRMELRIIKKGTTEYVQITYPNRDNSNLFQLKPSNLKIEDKYVVGPLPPKDAALRIVSIRGGGTGLIDDLLAGEPMPRAFDLINGREVPVSPEELLRRLAL